MAVTTWLIDKSALARLAASPDTAEWAGRIERGLVRITIVTRLEVGYSARSGPDLRAELPQPPLSAVPVEYLTPAIEDRAAEVLTLLADPGPAPRSRGTRSDHCSDSRARRAHGPASRQGLRGHSQHNRPARRAPGHSVTAGHGRFFS